VENNNDPGLRIDRYYTYDPVNDVVATFNLSGQFHVFRFKPSLSAKEKASDTFKVLDVKVSPNPFNPSTTIRFDLPEASTVDITIYDVLGREVWSLDRGKRALQAGSHELVWNGTDHDNTSLPAGVYLVELRTTEFRQADATARCRSIRFAEPVSIYAM